MDKKKSIKKIKLKSEFKTRKSKAEAIFKFLDTVVDTRGTSFESQKASITEGLLQSSLLRKYGSCINASEVSIPNCSSNGISVFASGTNYATNCLYNSYNSNTELGVSVPLASSNWALRQDGLSLATIATPSYLSFGNSLSAELNTLACPTNYNSLSAKYYDGLHLGLGIPSYQTLSNSMSCRASSEIIGSFGTNIYHPLSSSYENEYEGRYSCRIASLGDSFDKYCAGNYGTYSHVESNIVNQGYFNQSTAINELDSSVSLRLKMYASGLTETGNDLDLSDFDGQSPLAWTNTNSYSKSEWRTKIHFENRISFESYIEQYLYSGGFYESFRTRIEEAKIYFGDGEVVKFLKKLFRKLVGVGKKIFALSRSSRLLDIRNIIRKRIKDFHSCIGEEDELIYSFAKIKKYFTHLKSIITNEKRSYRTACIYVR